MVYAQDVAPSDHREGVLWVDTSQEDRPLYVYNPPDGRFIPVATNEQEIYLEHYETGYPDNGQILTESGSYSLPNEAVPFEMYFWHEYANDCSVTTEVTLNFTDGSTHTERHGKHSAGSGSGHTATQTIYREELRSVVPQDERVESVDWWHEWDGSDRTDYTNTGKAEVQIEFSPHYPAKVGNQ